MPGSEESEMQAADLILWRNTGLQKNRCHINSGFQQSALTGNNIKEERVGQKVFFLFEN